MKAFAAIKFFKERWMMSLCFPNHLASESYLTLNAQIDLWLSNRLVNVSHLNYFPRQIFSYVFYPAKISSVDFYFNSLNIFRYHLGHSTSSSTVELVYSVRILSFAGGNGLRDHGRAGISSFNGLERIVVFEVHDVDSFKLLCGLFQLLHMTVSWSSSSWCIRARLCLGFLFASRKARRPTTNTGMEKNLKLAVPISH